MTILINPYVYPVVPPVPFSYSNQWGQGDRTADLIVTPVDFTPSAGDVNNIVNGSTVADAGGSFRMPLSGSPVKTFTVLFPSAVEIDEIEMLNSSSGALGDWRCRAKLGGGGYSAIAADYGWASTQQFITVTSIFPLDTLEFAKVSGTTNPITWIEEFNFRIRPA